MTPNRPPWFLKLIILQLFLKGIIVLPFSIWLFTLIHKDLEGLTQKTIKALNLNVDNPYILLLENMVTARPTILTEISIGLFLYATLLLVEAYGLHQRRRWAEYLTVGVISCFIPFEIYDLFQRVSLFSVALLVLNIAIVHYLIKHKELFPKKSSLPTK
ncbi:MAG TPA: DUF2127 domain-containing protein [Nitrospiria bacterium]